MRGGGGGRGRQGGEEERAYFSQTGTAGFTALIMQADMLWGELWYQHAATDMGSGPQGCRRGGGGGGGGGSGGRSPQRTI